VAVLTVLVAASARAEFDYRVQPLLFTDASYETNPDSVEDDDTTREKDDAYIGTLTAALRWSAISRTSSYDFNPRIRARASWGNDTNDQLDGNDYFLEGGGSWLWSRSQAGVRASYSRLPSREDEFPAADENNNTSGGGSGCLVSDESGSRCRVEEDQDRWQISPNYRLSINPRTRLDIGSGISSTRYSEAELTNRFDYEYYSGSTSLTRVLARQHELSARLTFSYYNGEQPGSDRQTESYTQGIGVGYVYVLSPQSTLNADVGVSFSRLRYTLDPPVPGEQRLPCLQRIPGDPPTFRFVPCSLRSDDTNVVGSVSLERKLEDRITAGLGVSREIQPNSDGSEVVADSFWGQYDYSFTPRLGGTISARYFSQQALGSNEVSSQVARTELDRDYARIETTLRWKLTRTWSVSAQYNYFIDKRDSTIGVNSSTYEQDNNIVVLSVQYVGLNMLRGF
jgi:hypothetical protein